MNKILKALALVSAIALTTSLTPASAAESKPTMTLSETVTITAIPDAAKLNFEIYAEVDASVSKPSSQATKNLAKLTSQARKTLSSMKISSKDITSTNINISPQYQYIQEACKIVENSQTNTNCLTGYQKISSYRASQSFTVFIRDIDIIGGIIDQLSELEQITLQPVQPQVTQKKKYINQARREAVQSIQETAQLYASALSIKLGKISQLTESTNNPFPPYPIFVGRAEVSDAPTKIDLGTTDITVTVTITYLLP